VNWNKISDARSYAESLLVGEEVRLRGLTESDLATLESWWYDPVVQVFQTPQIRPGLPAGTETQFRTWSENTAPSSVGFCVERRSDHQLAGHVALFGITGKDRAAMFGIVMGPEFQNQGLGTQAARLMVDYGFAELGLNRIGLHVYAFNDRAIAAYRKAGFVEEGRIRQLVFHDGEFHDEVLMGILADDWRASRSGAAADTPGHGA
jgi:RimJ/RimL family protein N-acetyltransferase